MTSIGTVVRSETTSSYYDLDKPSRKPLRLILNKLERGDVVSDNLVIMTFGHVVVVIITRSTESTIMAFGLHNTGGICCPNDNRNICRPCKTC